MSDMPPRWADALLRTLLPARDRETVSGDLLEQYRDSVRPASGGTRADAWYLGQVVGLAWRHNRVAAVVLLVSAYAGAGLPRYVLSADPFATPRLTFALGLGASLGPASLVLFFLGWRARSAPSGMASGFVASTLASAVFWGGIVLGMVVWQAEDWGRLAYRIAVSLAAASLCGAAVAAIGGGTRRALTGLRRRD